jgi:type I restriction-modification system DNA methylase subunit
LERFDWKRLNEDLLKMLYQELVDPADRSGLGEYYTPDWLAERVLEDIGYNGGVLLDPASGSGTFLFRAVRRLKKQGLSGEGLIRFAMESLIGLDVHPVAVLMTKANIILGLASELRAK